MMESKLSDRVKDFVPSKVNGGDGAPKAADTASSLVDHVEKSIGDASNAVQETARRVWSQAGEAAGDLADTSRSAGNFVARQINDPPLAAMLLGAAAIGYFASLLIHGRR